MCTPEPSATTNVALILLEAVFTGLFALLRVTAKGVQHLAVGLIALVVWAAPKLHRATARAIEKRHQTVTAPTRPRPAAAPATVRRPVAALPEQSAAGVTLTELFGKQPANTR